MAPHTHRNPGAFKGRPGGRRSAQHPLAIAHHQLAVGAQIHQAHQFAAVLESRRKNAREDVAADKTSQARQEAYCGTAGEIPAQIARRERLQSGILGFERMVSKRCHWNATEEVVHDGVAHEDHFSQLPVVRRFGQQLPDHLAQLFADEAAQPAGTFLAERELDPTHDVRAMLGLSVQAQAYSEDVAGAQVQKLGDHRGGSEVHSHSEPVLRMELEARFVGEDHRLPLREFQLQVAGGVRATGQPPARRQILGREQLLILARCGQIAGQHLHPAALAFATPAARELDSLRKQDVPQWRTWRDLQPASQRQQINLNQRLHVRIVAFCCCGGKRKRAIS